MWSMREGSAVWPSPSFKIERPAAGAARRGLKALARPPRAERASLRSFLRSARWADWWAAISRVSLAERALKATEA
eukprot:803697-Alexandrium_andersonii.AAC.1